MKPHLSVLTALAILIVLGGALYSPGLSSAFTAEDFAFLPQQSFDTLWAATLAAPRPRLIAMPFDWLMVRLFGDNPFGYHAVMLSLHLGVTLLLYQFCRNLTGNAYSGLLAALVYIVFPRHHQPVLWWAGNPFILTTFFGLVTLNAHCAYLETRRFGWQALTWASLTAAILSYEFGVVLFPLLPLVELVRLPRAEWGPTWRSPGFYARYAPLLVIALPYFGLMLGGERLLKLSSATSTAKLQTSSLAGDCYHINPLGFGLVKDFVAYLTYLFFPFIPLRSLDFGVAAGALAAGAGLSLAAALIRGGPGARFAVGWIVLGLLIFVVFVPFGNADRYFYFAAGGVALLAGEAGVQLVSRLYRWRPALSLTGAAILLLGYLTASALALQQRISEWRQAGIIAATILQETGRLVPHPEPDHPFVYANLPGYYGQAYVFQGGGLSWGLQRSYGDTPFIRVRVVEDPEVAAFLGRAQPVAAPIHDCYVLLYQTGHLTDVTNVVADTAQLHPEKWTVR